MIAWWLDYMVAWLYDGIIGYWHDWMVSCLYNCMMAWLYNGMVAWLHNGIIEWWQYCTVAWLDDSMIAIYILIYIMFWTTNVFNTTNSYTMHFFLILNTSEKSLFIYLSSDINYLKCARQEWEIQYHESTILAFKVSSAIPFSAGLSGLIIRVVGVEGGS